MSCASCALAKAGFLPLSSWFIYGICILFAAVAIGTIWYASKSGQIKEIEGAKWAMLDAESRDDWMKYERPEDYRNVEGYEGYVHRSTP